MTYRPLFTASRLDSIMRCPGASTLPYIEEQPRDQTLALAGTTEHAQLLQPGKLPENLLTWLATCAPASAAIYERSFTVDYAVDPPHSLTRGYKQISSPSESGGTCDVFNVISTSDGSDRLKIWLRLADLKTGAGQASGTLPQPADSWQLRYYALAVLLWLGWPNAADLGSCEVAWFTRDYEAEQENEPDLAPDERTHLWKITSAHLSEELLRDSVEQLKELTAQLTARPADVWREGPWCVSCPVFKACPVQKSPVTRLGIALENARDELTAETVARVYEASEPVRRLLEQADTLCARYVEREGPIETRAGYVLRRERVDRRTVTPMALPVLRAMYPAEYQKMVRESTSVGRIAQALGEKVPGPLTKALVEKLRKISGAVVETSTFTLRERKGGAD